MTKETTGFRFLREAQYRRFRYLAGVSGEFSEGEAVELARLMVDLGKIDADVLKIREQRDARHQKIFDAMDKRNERVRREAKLAYQKAGWFKRWWNDMEPY